MRRYASHLPCAHKSAALAAGDTKSLAGGLGGQIPPPRAGRGWIAGAGRGWYSCSAVGAASPGWGVAPLEKGYDCGVSYRRPRKCLKFFKNLRAQYGVLRGRHIPFRPCPRFPFCGFGHKPHPRTEKARNRTAALRPCAQCSCSDRSSGVTPASGSSGLCPRSSPRCRRTPPVRLPVAP
jgi:hypothetical protein